MQCIWELRENYMKNLAIMRWVHLKQWLQRRKQGRCYTDSRNRYPFPSEDYGTASRPHVFYGDLQRPRNDDYGRAYGRYWQGKFRNDIPFRSPNRNIKFPIMIGAPDIYRFFWWMGGIYVQQKTFWCVAVQMGLLRICPATRDLMNSKHSWQNIKMIKCNWHDKTYGRQINLNVK